MILRHVCFAFLAGLATQTASAQQLVPTRATVRDIVVAVDARLGSRPSSSAAFVADVYASVFDVHLPASASELWKSGQGQRIYHDEDELRPGDVLFYRDYTGNEDDVAELGIYLNDEDGIAHLTPAQGIVLSSGATIHGYCFAAKRFVDIPDALITRGSSSLKAVVKTQVTRSQFEAEVRSWLGTPYVWGAAQKRRGSDCSGFITTVCRAIANIELPRSSHEIWAQDIGAKVQTKDLMPGDLLFFSYGARVSHVAFYLGDGNIIHARNPKELLGIDPLAGHYQNHLTGAKRFFALATGGDGKTERVAAAVPDRYFVSDQENVHLVRVSPSDRDLLVEWTFVGGSTERQVAIPVKDAAFLKKNGKGFTNPSLYRYEYSWKGNSHRGTLVVDELFTQVLEIDENLTETRETIYAWAPTEDPAKAVASDGFQTGEASYYADKYHGRKTASGEVFDMHAMTAAHRTLPFDTKVKVTRTDTKKSVVVRINDRGPFVKGRIIDLSLAAAKQLDITQSGVANVLVEIVQ